MIRVTKSQYKVMDEQVQKLEQALQQALLERDRAKSSDGDRSENSALDAAEREVVAATLNLDTARRNLINAVVCEDIDTSQVNVLTQVKISIDRTEPRWISIVDADQGYPPNHVSINSKLGAAMLGHPVGTSVTYQDNHFNTRTVEILEIREDSMV